MESCLSKLESTKREEEKIVQMGYEDLMIESQKNKGQLENIKKDIANSSQVEI